MWGAVYPRPAWDWSSSRALQSRYLYLASFLKGSRALRGLDHWRSKYITPTYKVVCPYYVNLCPFSDPNPKLITLHSLAANTSATNSSAANTSAANRFATARLIQYKWMAGLRPIHGRLQRRFSPFSHALFRSDVFARKLGMDGGPGQPNAQSKIQLITWFLLVVAILGVCARLGTRYTMTSKLSRDDWLLLVALVGENAPGSRA